MRNSGVRVDDSPFVPMSADDVAAGALDALGKGPVHVAGAQNQQMAAALWPAPRQDIIAGMSAGAASLYDLPVPPTPRSEGP